MKSRFLLVILFFGIALYAQSQETQFVFPTDAGVIDVTKAPYNADKTGTVDATSAIQTALNAYPNGNRTIYFPNGTYLISNTLKWPEGSGGNTFKRTMIQGESKSGVIIKLKDNCDGFQNPTSRKPMIYTGPAPAQRFRNAIRGITVNTGSGNPGAVGIQFNCSNEGTMQHVKIISGDGAGVYGLDLNFTDEIGPGYVYDLTVEGFDYGICHGFAINSMTFEKIQLKNQRIAGFWNKGNVCPIRGLTSENSVTAIKNEGSSSTMILMDANLTGGVDTVPAIINTGVLYARNINRTGYNRMLKSTSGLAVNVEGNSIKEYNSHGLYHQFSSPAASLNLPVKDWPEVPWSDLSQWANVRTYGALGNNVANDGPAIQDAIDAGKETVYFPGGYTYKTADTIRIRGNVRRIIGCETALSGSAIFVVEDGLHDTVVFERITAIYSTVKMINRSSRTLVLNSVSDLSLTSNGTGDLFLINYVSGTITLNNPAQKVWGRQINTESGDATNIQNNGAALWILGLKTERGKTKIHTRSGGKTEVLGVHNYSTTAAKTDPWFIVEEASFSAAGARETNFAGSAYSDYVKEIRNGISKTITRSYFPSSAVGGSVIPLYTGYAPADPIPLSPSNISFTQQTASSWKLDWDPVTSGGVEYYSVYLSLLKEGPYTMIANYLTNTELIYNPDTYTTYYFIVTAVNSNGMESAFSGEIEAIVPQPAPPLPPTGLAGKHLSDSIVIRWNKNKEFELEHYEIYRALTPGTFFLPIATNVKDTFFTDKTIAKDKIYHYNLRAVNAYNDKSNFSDTIIVSPANGIVDPSTGGNLRIYPNPVSDWLYVDFSEQCDQGKLVMYTLTGRKVAEKYITGKSVSIPVYEYPKGFYFIEIVTDRAKYISKIVIVNPSFSF